MYTYRQTCYTIRLYEKYLQVHALELQFIVFKINQLLDFIFSLCISLHRFFVYVDENYNFCTPQIKRKAKTTTILENTESYSFEMKLTTTKKYK